MLSVMFTKFKELLFMVVLVTLDLMIVAIVMLLRVILALMIWVWLAHVVLSVALCMVELVTVAFSRRDWSTELLMIELLRTSDRLINDWFTLLSKRVLLSISEVSARVLFDVELVRLVETMFSSRRYVENWDTLNR